MLKQQSHIVAPIPDELRTRALYTVNELRERGKADKIAIDKLFELIVEMTDNGLDFFFLEPLRRLNASSMLMGMARMGISSMLKGSKMVVHKDSRLHRGNHPRAGTRCFLTTYPAAALPESSYSLGTRAVIPVSSS